MTQVPPDPRLVGCFWTVTSSLSVYALKTTHVAGTGPTSRFEKLGKVVSAKFKSKHTLPNGTNAAVLLVEVHVIQEVPQSNDVDVDDLNESFQKPDNIVFILTESAFRQYNPISIIGVSCPQSDDDLVAAFNVAVTAQTLGKNGNWMKTWLKKFAKNTAIINSFGLGDLSEDVDNETSTSVPQMFASGGLGAAMATGTSPSFNLPPLLSGGVPQLSRSANRGVRTDAANLLSTQPSAGNFFVSNFPQL